MLLWIAIALLVDAALCLWFSERMQERMPGVPITKLAIAEALVAAALAAMHFLL